MQPQRTRDELHHPVGAHGRQHPLAVELWVDRGGGAALGRVRGRRRLGHPTQQHQQQRPPLLPTLAAQLFRSEDGSFEKSEC